MESTPVINTVNPSEVRSETLGGEKRPLENGEDTDLILSPAKKAKSDVGLGENVRKVAEIVLVLATMGKMRAGRKPTPAEVEMMAEAREKLAELCKEFAPKDIFPRDAFGTVIEDLGLNRLREQQLGIRPPKISIAEKLKLTKQKMEKSAEYFLHSAAYSSQRLQTNLGGAAESRGTSHAVRMFPSDKPSHVPISSGSFQHPSTLVHASPANARSLPYQLPTSEVRPVVSSVLPGSHPGRDSSSSALPRVERPHFRLDGRSNGSSYTSQPQANPSGDHNMAKTPTWSMQPQSASLAIVGSDKVPTNNSVKAEDSADSSTSRMATQATPSKPFNTQTTAGNPPSIHHHLHGTNYIPTPITSDNHNEISKIVQKLLQPQLPEHPTWTPPSRDYMKKPLTCQMCKIAINEVDTALVCDACESGYHLRCLQCNAKTIPRGEWHCGKCLAHSNGKPLPPKYGRVMRNTSTPKMSSHAATAVQPSLENKVQTSDENFNQQKITENGDSGLQSVSSGTTGNNDIHPPHTIKMAESREVQGPETHREKLDDKFPPETFPSNLVERSCEEQLVTRSKSQPVANLESVISSADLSQALGNHQYDNQTRIPNSAGALSNQSQDTNLTAKDSEKSYNGGTIECNQNVEIKDDEQAPEQANPIETFGSSIGVREHDRSSRNSMYDVKWIGDILKVVDEKTYYQSCCINGAVYKVQDHALFYSTSGKYMPNKLQAMWEDSKTGSKWVTVNRCYFPRDLPEGVGRPCSPESNEVYESNHESTLMAGLIHGPCDVLPPNKFFEESEMRTRSRTGASDGLRPRFLCKWFYDETKVLFRDVTC